MRITDEQLEGLCADLGQMKEGLRAIINNDGYVDPDDRNFARGRFQALNDVLMMLAFHSIENYREDSPKPCGTCRNNRFHAADEHTIKAWAENGLQTECACYCHPSSPYREGGEG